MSKDEANKFDFIKKNSAWGKNTTDKVKKTKTERKKKEKKKIVGNCILNHRTWVFTA